MPICVGFKRNGRQCTATVEPPQEYCWWHDPANAEQRRKSASKAAKSKGTGELSEVRQQLRDIANDVLSGDLDKGAGSVAAQVLGVYIRAVEQERKIREQDELLERLDALEQATQANGRGRRPWGA
jgi:hypothetical protein